MKKFDLTKNDLQGAAENFSFFQTHREKSPSNQLFSNFFSKTVTFTKFLLKEFESKFPEFLHTVTHMHTVWKNEKFSLTEKIFRQINSLVTYLVKPHTVLLAKEKSPEIKDL